MSVESKAVRETRLRRAADRQGLILIKRGRRDPRALDYGLYVLVGFSRDVAGRKGVGELMTLDQIERWLG